MKSPANDKDTPSGQNAKTVCLDCGCEFQAAGSGRDQQECPICSVATGHVEEPEDLEWAEILKPKPAEFADVQTNGASKAIEVEVTSTQQPSPEEAPPARLPVAEPPPASPSPLRPSPEPRSDTPPAAHRTPECTDALYEDLREIGFQIEEEDARDEPGS